MAEGKGFKKRGLFYKIALLCILFPLISSGFLFDSANSPTTKANETEPTLIPEDTPAPGPAPILSEDNLQESAALGALESENQNLAENFLIDQNTDSIHPIADARLADNIQPLEAADYSSFDGSQSYIIKVKDGISLEDYFQSLENAGFEIKEEIQTLDALVISGNFEDTDDLASLLPDGYQYIEENQAALSVLETPNDPYFSFQYGLELIHAPEGWEYEKGSAKITIAVIDTGVDLTHPDLVGKLVAGYNFVADNDDPQDDHGHGTGIAGICAAVTDNATGIAGVSWGASIMPVKVLDASGNGSFEDAAKGIIWAVDNGAQVINLSLGGNTSSSLLEDAVNYALKNGAVVVAAGGNGGANSITYPARYDGVIAVGSVGQSSQHSSFSNYGPELDVVAPGSGIYSLARAGNYAYITGTSAATPFTSGLTALMLSIKGSSYQKITKQICKSSLDLGDKGPDDFFGCGLIQVDKALKRVLSAHKPQKVSQNTLNTTVAAINPQYFQNEIEIVSEFTNQNHLIQRGIGKKENQILFTNDYRPKTEYKYFEMAIGSTDQELPLTNNSLFLFAVSGLIGLGIVFYIKTRSAKNGHQ